METINDGSSNIITTEEGLREIYKQPAGPALLKQTDHVTEPGRAVIEAAPMIMMATAGDSGIDVSPKGDGPGFVQVLDNRTLLIPDRPGNNRLDGITNILKNPKVGIIFLVPGSNTTYRVNGTAQVSKDPALLERFLVNNKAPRTIIVVKVEEAYSHCPKAFIRANLWQAGGKGHPEGVPNAGDFAAHRDGGDSDYAREYNENYKKRLPNELY
jgi:PPOX class probable FMN-dependent enzyme